ncbi:MAG: aminotransferase class I/II-fold pyridoxal phosphate-dependent enzyme [Clostridiales bacterium]|nr:aminotransferase class I/II-fold pyridoxal phosphate-dependent enzyme [Clostridiales bacterium]
MIRFNCDYGEGAHPRILERLSRTNFTQTPGYGEDEFCREAADIIRGLCEAPGADVHFLTVGTQANLTVLSAALRPHQGVLSAETGHIAAHETGAVEATGHKVLALPHENGKISAEQIGETCRLHFADDAHEHIVMPGAVYVSNPTELGTIYARRELQALREVCDRWDMIMFVDGARLGYGLAAPGNDLTLPFLASVADAFTIGGTKVGALFGEAVVLANAALKRDFRYIIKQKGGMLAKGRLLGIQFSELLRDGLYFELSEHAVKLALRLKEALAGCGYPFLVDSPTNQQFPILPDALLSELGSRYTYSHQMRVDESRSAVRFCTSWATRPEDVDTLIEDIRRNSHA